MEKVQKTIILTREQDNWIRSQIAAGEYRDESEYICALIRDAQLSYQKKQEMIRTALADGESSGRAKPVDLSAFKKRMETFYG